MTGPFVLLASVLLALSAVFGLGFFLIRVIPRELPFRVFYPFLRLRRLVPLTTLLLTIATAILAGLPWEAWIFIGLQALIFLVDYISYEPRLFRAVKAPEFEADPASTTLDPGALVVILEVGGEGRAYPLTYVAHHEVINDTIGGRRVALSFCNMCNTAIPFDVTDWAGPRGFEVVAEYRGNMILQDLDTHTIWQQITGESLTGRRHPSKLPILPCQILNWGEARFRFPQIRLAKTTSQDRRPFDIWFLPWARLQRSSYILGLRQRDGRLSARTRVIGIERIGGHVAYLTEELARRGWIRNDELHLLIVMTGDWAHGFLTEVEGRARKMSVQQGRIVDEESGSAWDMKGRGLSGTLSGSKLVVWPTHEGYWFGWSEFHRLTSIIRVEDRASAQ